MRLIKVKYIPQIDISSDTNILLRVYESAKAYSFIIDDNEHVNFGDLIRSNQYLGYMLITSIIMVDNLIYEEYLRLKKSGIKMVKMSLHIESANFFGKTIFEGTNNKYVTDEDFKNNQLNNMEKRNISVTLEQAMEWYKQWKCYTENISKVLILRMN